MLNFIDISVGESEDVTVDLPDTRMNDVTERVYTVTSPCYGGSVLCVQCVCMCGCVCSRVCVLRCVLAPVCGICMRAYTNNPEMDCTCTIVKANIYEISTDTHQLHYIPLHHFTIYNHNI